jgi:hypothetical protein
MLREVMPMIVAPPVPVPAVQDSQPAVKPFEIVAEWLEPVRTMLAGKFGADKMDRVDALLLETGAIIAGGSILRAVSPWNTDVPGLRGNRPRASPEVNDLDIYVPVRMTPRLIDGLYTGREALLESRKYKVLPASSYCESFLRKNGIRRVHTFANGLGETPTDIMSVRHRRSVQQVVTNFDLTICQIWYDGAHVYASHPQDIRDKRATLQSDYVVALMRGNPYIRKRLDKYMKRGFSISVEGARETFDVLPTDQGACAKKQNQFRDRKTKPEFWNRWFASVATAWLSGSATTFRTAKSYLPSIADNMLPSKNVLIPLSQNLPYLSAMNARGMYLITKGLYSFYSMPLDSFWNNFKDTGYDSEDYENVDNRQALAAEFMSTVVPDIAWQADSIRAFALAMNKFLEYQMLPIKYSNRPENMGEHNDSIKISDGFTLGTILYKNDIPSDLRDSDLKSLFMEPEVYNFYAANLAGQILRKADVATDYAGAGELVYDIHNHPLAAGISKGRFIDYLRHYRGGVKNEIPCYWRDCNKTLALTEIHHILGREGYKRWIVPPMWKGFSQSDISRLDSIFSINSVEANNSSCCPVCLSFVHREDGCMYILNHRCNTITTNFSRDLYNKYKNEDDTIVWCTICGRICSKTPHRHYALGPASGAKSEIINPDAIPSYFGNDCTGFGGGNILEKFIRFQKLREVANLLQTQANKITAKEAKEYLIQEVWNAPLNISPIKKQALQSFLENKRFNIPNTVFPSTINAENTENIRFYPNIPYPNGAGADPLLPIVHTEGDDSVTMAPVRPAIQFLHRRQNGEINTHEDEYIGLESLFNLLETRYAEYERGDGGDIGMCWNYPDCTAKIHPQEIQSILTRIDTNPDISAENKSRYREIYNVYKSTFNKIFEHQRGGRRATRRGRRKQKGGDNEVNSEETPFFVEATDAACMLPRRGNATVAPTARKRSTRKRKTLRRRRRATRHR